MLLFIAVGAPAAVSAKGVARIDIEHGRLTMALTAVGRQAGVDILYSETLVGERTGIALHGTMTVESALAKLLAGSGLGFHRTADDAIVINAASDSLPAAVATPIETIPEILVVGRHAQNGDIGRTEGDIQPYQVSSRRTIEDSHSDSIQDFTRKRLPANAQIASPAQDFVGGAGSTRSEINLRGLGPAQTLVLIDGRRMPSLPGLPYAFDQPDINGIPIDAVDRIETLTATAGGIYGPGATSGVVNIILRHDYRGAEISLTTGLTARGDAPEVRLEGRIGFTPDHGQTDVTINVSATRSGELRYGDRDFIARARRQSYANDPAAFLASLPVGNAINVFGSDQLVLKAQLGGAALGSTITSLPLGLIGDSAQRTALLVANAGGIDISLPDALGGARDDIVSRPRGQAILFNARHRFGSSGIEAFADVIDTRDDGRADGRAATLTNFIAGTNPANPFQQDVTLTFPLTGVAATQSTDIHILRYTAGLIAPLPRRWRANLEYTGGIAQRVQRTALNAPGDYLYLAYSYGQPYGGRQALDPFGNWADFVAALQSYSRTTFSLLDQTSHLGDATFRLAGPLLTLPGGTATVTLQAEDRREHVGASSYILSDTGSFMLDFGLPRIEQTTSTLAGEMRIPVSGSGGLLRNFELQLAVRRDVVRTILPATVTLFTPDPPPFVTRNSAFAYTVGARFQPIPAITLRASASTGILPPSIAQIGSSTFLASRSDPDPKRGGRPVGSEGEFTLVNGGSASLRPEQARSLSAGIIFTPFGDSGLRASADFTRIDKRDEIGPVPGLTIGALLADDNFYPGRIERGPLTAADAAMGFTAGPVTRIDLTTANIARSRLDAVDLTLDWPVSLRRSGDLRVYVNATLQPSYWQQAAAGLARRQRIGYSDGPLEWRGNGGVDWTLGALRLGLNGQFYASYLVASSSGTPASNAQLIAYQGSDRIPAQVYFDLTATYHFDRGGPVPHGTQVRFGVLDVFDQRPPTVTDPNTTGYSYYGDPRRRRFELTVAVPFGG
ncbi:TonB-dependent receptor [Polymorphobacter megasporae]|uniref:TonB-dependent receptor n=1 Tax=Glacieibacterium megasporae TaxID=2835787 RepID=UPI001CAA64CD|nr:TonB-dependent receptor [Polymorphobacter megasporae]UAJ12531.1 TonB-dependent receptor [Polymorphobacter megasporae]